MFGYEPGHISLFCREPVDRIINDQTFRATLAIARKWSVWASDTSQSGIFDPFVWRSIGLSEFVLLISVIHSINIFPLLSNCYIL